MKKGSLIVVGSGIKGVAHFTVEAQGWIREADVVPYCVSDPVSEVWIKENSKHSIDLYQFYGNEKQRINTYNEMVDEILSHVRSGKDTCAVFYGHPGIFVHPSHKAISIARSEGYKAAMLPGISALDCLCADLGVDPSVTGMQTVEATDLLLRNRRLNTDQNVVIWQIGCVGDLGFNFSGYDNRNLKILVEYLEKFYAKDHMVTHYQGSQYSICPPSIAKMPLSELKNAPVTGISTLYIPPQDKLKLDEEMVQRLGLRKTQTVNTQKVAEPVCKTDQQKVQPRKASYNQYVAAPDQSELANFLAELSESPLLLAQFMRNPEITSSLMADLSPSEKDALFSQHPGKIRMAIKLSSWNKHLKGVSTLIKQRENNF
ncbi:SAM-dependent methyltransferase [Brevibacillus laterosporus]|uniref:SAM-dependent methyltransferase n=1 Tax=Brevibacillus laterosporus TaxID=1465 RepID=UPI00215C839A|nr:SAM-dependent methyltransferase [Brevibacillus laterosporus]MCR8997435.1 SAM-dependent methyltransferase [Brevibacillus laterosporus]